MHLDPMSMIICHQAGIQQAMIEAERRRLVAECVAADETGHPSRKASRRTPIRRIFRRTVVR
ncbi:hypothetical protein [Brachybacterium hainanense]|uniref:Transposase n=1 Tax=Brachybacterium hainanense TaxID=1541174 RepID=A0ABV6R9C0_9MICO